MDTEQPSLHPLNDTSQKVEEISEIKNNRGPAPPDRFFYIYGLQLILGLTSLMASTYIFSANDVGIVLTTEFV